MSSCNGSAASAPIAPHEWPGVIGLWRQEIDLELRTKETDDTLRRAAELEQEAYDLTNSGNHADARRRLRHATSMARLAIHEGLIEAPPEPEVPPFLTDADVENLPPVEYLVGQIIPIGATAEVHGPPGSAKSFFALSLVCAVATGRGFCSHPVRKGVAVYVVGEGINGTGARLRAWKAEHCITGQVGVFFKHGAVQLLNAHDVSRFLVDLKALDQAPALIVFDTLARCMIGGDENSAKDMGLVIAAVDRIRDETGAAVLIVHHTGKSGESERGSTALRGAVDSMFSLKNESGRVTLSCEKQKDAPAFAPITLRIKPVGDSCVLITPPNAWESTAESFTPNHRKALETLARSFLADGASCSAWMKASGLKDATFYRTRSDLVNWGYARPDSPRKRPNYTATEKGRELLGTNSQDTLNSFPESSVQNFHQVSPLYNGGNGESNGDQLHSLGLEGSRLDTRPGVT